MKFIHVVAAIVEKNDKILLAKRPQDKHQGGLWEFPGGKVEEGETPKQALRRELKEEVNIDIRDCQSFLKIHHQYADKAVYLDVYKVSEFAGEAEGLENQQVKWVRQDQLHLFQFPAANKKILSALQVPELVSITAPDISGEFSQHDADILVGKIKKYGLQGVLLRAPSLDDKQYIKLYRTIQKCLSENKLQNSVSVISNRKHLLEDIQNIFLHLSASELAKQSNRPDVNCLSASCHNVNEIHLAEKLACDFIFLAPLLNTDSHPDAHPLGWEEAGALIQKTDLPVVLLGGLKPEDLDKAKNIGALGVAGISGF